MIEAEDEAARRDLEGDVGVRALRRGVDAGVGAAGAVEADRRVEELRERFLDDLLDAERVGLRLPAAVAGAEVLEGEEEAQARLLNLER